MKLETTDIAVIQKQLLALPKLLLPWYGEHARVLPWRADRQPYHVWLSEIMLQQTRVEAVKQYYNRFLAKCPDIATLAQIPDDALNKLWEGLGYYSRVRNMKKAALEICSRYDGVFPTTYDQVAALPGIGPYTAGAICSICFELPEPAVDGNVLRLITRILADSTPITKPAYRIRAAQALCKVYPAGQCGAFTQSLMELGALICLPNGTPLCAQCPLACLCRAYAQGTQLCYPVKEKKPPRKVEEKTVFVLQCGPYQAVLKRPPEGLLAGLWEYPNVCGTLTAPQAIAQVEQWGAHPQQLLQKKCKRHIFTHIEWHMSAYYVQCGHMCPRFHWVKEQQMKQEIALPTAFGMFKPQPVPDT